MDSTTPDPTPQQQQQPPQTQPQQQPKPQQQPQPQPQPQPHQHQTAQPASYQPIHPAAYQQHRFAYPHPNYPHQAPFNYYPPYAHGHYSPQQWAQPASYTPAPAQPISNMVNPQPQSNVPQQHNKPSSQIMNPVINTDRPHNQSLQAVTVPNQSATVARIRERKPAILKDPSTNKEVPLPSTTTSTTKSTSSASKQSTNALTTTNTTTSVEHVHKLLQKVSEDNDIGQETNNKQQQIKKPPTCDEKDPSVVDDSKKEEKESNPPAAALKQEPGQYTPNSKDLIKDKEVPLPTTTTTSTTKAAAAPTTTTTIAATTAAATIPTTTATKATIATIATTTATTTKSSSSASEQPTNSLTTTNTTTQVENVQKPLQKVSEEKDIGQETNNEQQEITLPNCDEKDASAEDDSKEEEEEQQVSDPLTSLNYIPGQYHPITNRTGKKVYSKQFMLDVCEKILKLDLLHQESDDKIEMEGNRLQSAFSEKIDMFAPAYSSSSQRYTPTNRQNDPARRQSQHNYAGRSSAGQERQRKIITSVSLTQEVELKTANNPWRPTKEIKEDAPVDGAETESLKKKFRSILNKLTPNNFENLAKAVTNLNIDTESKLGEVIDIVFAKALAEPGYCVLYGQMCSHLKKITAGTANFGNTLLRRCQNQFQSDIYSGIDMQGRKEKIDNEENEEVKKQLNEELYEEMYRCRMRGLGLIKFIGELYKIQMLNDKIMFECVLRLLSDTSEESLECLCDLLTTIGEKLDRSSQNNVEKEKKTPKSVPKANAYQGGQKSAAAVVASGLTAAQQQQKLAEQQAVITSLDQVFEQLHKIRKNKELDLSVRIRFKLLDTCELREKENWQSKKTKDNNPKKLEEIREAHKEKLEQERRQQNAMGPRRSQEGRRGLGHPTGSSSQLSSLANESGTMRGSSTMHTSSSSHLIRDHSIGDNMNSNHNDIESQKEFKRKLESLKGLSPMILRGGQTNVTSSSEPLRPNSTLTLRPMNHRGK